MFKFLVATHFFCLYSLGFLYWYPPSELALKDMGKVDHGKTELLEWIVNQVNIIEIIVAEEYIGQVMKVQLSCYLVLLSTDSKTR